MSRYVRSFGITGIAGAALVATLVVAATATAAPRTDASATKTAAHPCLVMAGAGDGAFTKNFNPYTGNGLPSGQIIRGTVYEGLTISPLGGRSTLPWLARSWKWSNGNKT